MIYIGIDPGQSGGIAAIYGSGVVLDAVYMPGTARDVLDHLERIVAVAGAVGCQAMIETVGVMPRQGISSAFTFGRSVGGLHMALAAIRIPFDQVVPRKWQAAMQCLSGGDKNVTKRRAQAVFPDYRITHAIADALLVAEYCRRIHRGIVRGGDHVKEAGAQAHTEAPGQAVTVAHKIIIEPTRFQGGRRAGKTHGHEITAAEARAAVSGATRARADARRPPR